MTDLREEPDFTAMDASEGPPSLLDGLLGRVRALAWPFWAAGALALLLAIVAMTAMLQARSARADAALWGERAAVAAQAREQAGALAAAMAVPPVESLLARLADRLPPQTRLAFAAREAPGTVTIVIDTADPDALRAALAADPHVRALRERGQDMREDGTFRVRLSGPLR